MYTFLCRLFRESSQVRLHGLEIITRVKNLSCVYMTTRVMETALVAMCVTYIPAIKWVKT